MDFLADGIGVLDKFHDRGRNDSDAKSGISPVCRGAGIIIFAENLRMQLIMLKVFQNDRFPSAIEDERFLVELKKRNLMICKIVKVDSMSNGKHRLLLKKNAVKGSGMEWCAYNGNLNDVSL